MPIRSYNSLIMVSASTFPNFLLQIALGCSLLAICFGIPNAVITPGNPVMDNQVVISEGGVFALGFFSPANSTNRYVGIWYNNIPGPPTVVWVANRENPIPDSSGSLAIAQDGNLAVLDGKNNTLWSTNLTRTSISNGNDADVHVVFRQSGNLVLRDRNEGALWMSFDYITDTLLPGMILWINSTTHQTWRARSWKDASDPAPGDYSWGIDLEASSLPQLVIWKGSNHIYRTGILDRELTPIPVQFRNGSGVIYLSTVVRNQQIYMSINSLSKAINNIRFRMVLTHSGRIEALLWGDSSQRWETVQVGTKRNCDVYNTCGPFGSCMLTETGIGCECVKGYEPKNGEEWSKRNWSSGCVRIKRMLGCGKGIDVQFLKMGRLILPDLALPVEKSSLRECEDDCRSDCSCLAYAFPNVADTLSSSCLIWRRELLDLRGNITRGQDLFLRVDAPAATELRNVAHVNRRNLLPFLLPPVFVLCFASVFVIHFLRKRICGAGKGKARTGGHSNNMKTSNSKHEIASEVPLFKFSTIMAATNNFDAANKLGEGGFGPVYKGRLMDQDVAVKRLSKFSRQGHLELKNEVELIVKLQHKNLVRLLGWYAHGEEKMLVYEYLPNKSLDRFLFADPTKKALLSWEKRFSIIEGIAQGLLYLHRHSRLKIIHRDLKASNILLDGDMNPKISDFGMARIFGGNQTEANTNRVVGTFGYMAPEYAFGGNFSEKSDVYSFGVLVIEIVTGKKITDIEYWASKPSIYPLGYAWHVWREGKGMELMDPTCKLGSFDTQQVLKCVKVGLLCVQEDANDRPTMASVISMLGGDGLNLLEPNMPAFYGSRTDTLDTHICSTCQETISIISPR